MRSASKPAGPSLFVPLLMLLMTLVLLAGCGSSDTTQAPIAAAGEYVVFAWNDLGMHCLNPTYEDLVILPPYNTVWAQVIRRGNPPQIVTSGLTVSYSIVGNTSSHDKTDDLGGDFAQFWAQDQALFGVDLPLDTGLNLADPSRHNGLSGAMVVAGDHFEVNGIPLVPVGDNGIWNPYQVIAVTVTDGNDTVVARTQATVPTSDEIDCAGCHAQNGPGTDSIGGGGANVFRNILAAHDHETDTMLDANRPVLCASCHSSPALGGSTTVVPVNYLSTAIHGSHAVRGASCYSCHPGAVTHCNRSIAHTAADGHCTACHGDMNNVASTITTGGRIPWVAEPACATCHTGVSGVDTGSVLYRNATGHGGVFCAACHGSPHAMVPSSVASDNYQAIQYQNVAKTIGSCGVCHGSSRGEGASEFGEEHGGADGRKTACHICHTVVPTQTSDWPHAFTWKAR